MATNPVFRDPELTCDVETRTDETVVHCSGRVVSDTTDSLKETVKPLFAPNKNVVLDLSNVKYMDSSGVGAMISLYVSSKNAHSQFKVINLNARLKELFSLTRVGEVLTKERGPEPQRRVLFRTVAG